MGSSPTAIDDGVLWNTKVGNLGFILDAAESSSPAGLALKGKLTLTAGIG